MEVTASAGYLQQPLYPAVVGYQGRKVREHGLPVDPAKSSSKLATVDNLLSTRAVPHICISQAEAGDSSAAFVEYRCPRHTTNPENRFQGIAHYQFVFFLHRPGKRSAGSAGDQLQVFPQSVIQGSFYGTKPQINGKPADDKQRNNNAQHQSQLYRSKDLAGISEGSFHSGSSDIIATHFCHMWHFATTFIT